MLLALLVSLLPIKSEWLTSIFSIGTVVWQLSVVVSGEVNLCLALLVLGHIISILIPVCEKPCMSTQPGYYFLDG